MSQGAVFGAIRYDKGTSQGETKIAKFPQEPAECCKLKTECLGTSQKCGLVSQAAGFNSVCHIILREQKKTVKTKTQLTLQGFCGILNFKDHKGKENT